MQSFRRRGVTRTTVHPAQLRPVLSTTVFAARAYFVRILGSGRLEPRRWTFERWLSARNRACLPNLRCIMHRLCHRKWLYRQPSDALGQDDAVHGCVLPRAGSHPELHRSIDQWASNDVGFQSSCAPSRLQHCLKGCLWSAAAYCAILQLRSLRLEHQVSSASPQGKQHKKGMVCIVKYRHQHYHPSKLSRNNDPAIQTLRTTSVCPTFPSRWHSSSLLLASLPACVRLQSHLQTR